MVASCGIGKRPWAGEGALELRRAKERGQGHDAVRHELLKLLAVHCELSIR